MGESRSPPYCESSPFAQALQYRVGCDGDGGGSRSNRQVRAPEGFFRYSQVRGGLNRAIRGRQVWKIAARVGLEEGKTGNTCRSPKSRPSTRRTWADGGLFREGRYWRVRGGVDPAIAANSCSSWLPAARGAYALSLFHLNRPWARGAFPRRNVRATPASARKPGKSCLVPVYRCAQGQA